MQPLDARQLFPYFDQSLFKSKFLLRVQHPFGLNAISNMPIYETKHLPGLIFLRLGNINKKFESIILYIKNLKF